MVGKVHFSTGIGSVFSLLALAPALSGGASAAGAVLLGWEDVERSSVLQPRAELDDV